MQVVIETVCQISSATSCYLTVNIRQSKALLLSLGLAVQTGLGAAAQPDQTTDYRLLLCYQTALLSHRGTLGLLESERHGHSPPCTQD